MLQNPILYRTIGLRFKADAIRASLLVQFMRRWDYVAMRAGGTHACSITDFVLVNQNAALLVSLQFHSCLTLGIALPNIISITRRRGS